MSNSRALRRRMARFQQALTDHRANRLDTRPAGVTALYKGRLNAYRCPACQSCTVTIDVDAGVTPSTLACRATDSCEGTAFSLGYPIPEAWPAGVTTQPAWEWYRPGERQLSRLRRRDPEAYEHVVKGGLLLRPYGAGRGPEQADLEPTEPDPAPASQAAADSTGPDVR
ncbi:hypothetical protein [Micromonospora aurantiaca (nom. illeg.)]|uniref:hypothetical protein n=1 Tax=Micromonospora aurantiaca (nom. illeg.) TaxID=47850 RepID=UPI0011A228E7|nr:hypothetical protein [Micromonospora aurantiaca]MBC9005161.1 hypothetical protein [Micromonospora aurantiaca]